ncbi:AT-rich interactive domain-containing protein 2-like isoform X2 [Culex pipiens pallens]|nr:AT-rich interactive domain-containing protein 2-like isoform X2 [Culex pipiens pallens]
MRGRNVDSHRLHSVVVARDWGDIIEEMALPKRCVNNEIALKKINFRFLDKYEKVYFHGEEKDPTKRRTTKSYIIGGGQRRCCTRCRRFTTPQLPAHKHSPRDGAASAWTVSQKKSVSFPK